MSNSQRGAAPSDAARSTWLLQGDPVKSGAVADAFSDLPETRLVSRIADDVLLVETTGAQVERLRALFGPTLLIEADQSLNPID